MSSNNFLHNLSRHNQTILTKCYLWKLFNQGISLLNCLCLITPQYLHKRPWENGYEHLKTIWLLIAPYGVHVPDAERMQQASGDRTWVDASTYNKIPTSSP